ncbi:DUF167 family protein [Neptunomonas qingdaonensis]|uniref:UPF0235 protein SAMN05216175_101350 n=1 Tax=Neptunomonas qingdaonensis TaxID=1045558 RepID=A0A1I2M2K3_9GAMM|nr:DUF167 family protein [Neptunomonas qingdaonensis]SFF84939.1 hypothetical protein SAMN05216175_101350 [Neptunomonas qingdaonensis]
MTFYRWQDNTLTLSCQIQPKSSRDEIVGLQADSVKIRITAPPVDGKANAHLIKFLAKAFGVSRSAVSIASGETGRKKVVRIEDPDKLPELLNIERT